jgi:hypothetical protein
MPLLKNYCINYCICRSIHPSSLLLRDDPCQHDTIYECNSLVCTPAIFLYDHDIWVHIYVAFIWAVRICNLTSSCWTDDKWETRKGWQIIVLWGCWYIFECQNPQNTIDNSEIICEKRKTWWWIEVNIRVFL